MVHPGEFIIIPRGVEHLPSADEETHVMLLEPKTTLNTGNVASERTVQRIAANLSSGPTSSPVRILWGSACSISRTVRLRTGCRTSGAISASGSRTNRRSCIAT